MQINEKTKIGKILKFHPDALESIISVNPIFEKLRNPVLRKLMAGRTSIAMAARVGGCSSADFFDALRPLGFVSVRDEASKDRDDNGHNDRPFEVKPEAVVTMDVRPILAGGEDPLNQILSRIKGLKPGEVLKIINTFEPTPLMSLLAKQGFRSIVEKRADNYVETLFYNEGGNLPQEVRPADMKQSGWEEMLGLYEDKTTTLDVRAMEMPLPMTTILEAVESLPDDRALFVFHRKVPVYLLPELSERNLEYRIKEISEDEVHILIFKQ
jgi:uncharacterized protein (DUF2249 family)